MSVRSYADAERFLGNKTDRPIGSGRATRLQRRDDETIALKLHATDVVTYHKSGRVTLNSGGWRTATTKARMNEFSPLRVSQDKGSWYVYGGGGVVPYAEGITFDPLVGKFKGQGEDPQKEQKLRARLRKFAGDYIAALKAGKVGEPGAGDCFGCQFRQADGSAGMGNDHILSHIEERYYVPSMITNAFKAFGAAQVQWWGLGALWGKGDKPETPEQKARMVDWATDARSKRMLTRWLYREMGLAA